jgi:hypothetical protein
MHSPKLVATWHLVEVFQRLVKKAQSRNPLPHGDFLQPLPVLVEQSQLAAKNEIERALKRDGGHGEGIRTKEVA